MIASEKERIQTEVMCRMNEMKELHQDHTTPKNRQSIISKFLNPFEMVRKENVKTKILLCEDNTPLAIVIRKLLEKKGFDVTVTETPAHFLSKERLSTFDFIITDNQMPYMMGTQFIEFVEKELQLAIPMYIYSGDSDLKGRIPLGKVLRGIFEKGAGFENVFQTILSDFTSYKDDLNAKHEVKLAITANTLMA